MELVTTPTGEWLTRADCLVGQVSIDVRTFGIEDADGGPALSNLPAEAVFEEFAGVV